MATDSWIALSSRYYMDEKLSGCSAGVERMFTRLLAYCRLADTGGNVPENAHILVQLPRQKSDVIALETRGILVPNSDRPGWHFPAWPDWQEKGDALQQRRKSDRERKRRQRQGVTGQSRDVSHGNPHLHNITEQEVPKGTQSATGHNAREREAPRGPSVGIDGWKIIRDVVPSEHPQATKTALALEASAMLTSGTPDTDVRAALELWLSKPNLGPRTLPSLVSEVIRSRDRPATNGNGHRTLTTRERTFLEAELMKSNPDPAVLAQFGHTKALENGS